MSAPAPAPVVVDTRGTELFKLICGYIGQLYGFPADKEIPADIILLIYKFAKDDKEAETKAEEQIKRALKKLGEDDKFDKIVEKKGKNVAWWNWMQKKCFRDDLEEITKKKKDKQ